jgi:hypothetical protein
MLLKHSAKPFSKILKNFKSKKTKAGLETEDKGRLPDGPDNKVDTTSHLKLTQTAVLWCADVM